MNETLITDIVAQSAMEQLEKLDKAMEGTLSQYKDVAQELAKGIKIPVEVSGDIDKLKQVYEVQMQKANQATQQLTQQIQQQQQVIANTTNTISRQLQEQEKLNKANREAFTQQQRALDVADRILGSHEQNVAMLAKYNKQLDDLKKAYKEGSVSSADYTRRQLELKTAKQELQRILANEQKTMQAAEGSYKQLSLQLERLKMAQKQLNEQEKSSAEGLMLEKEIQDLSAHLKDLDADMGDFHRNVGNYAIAGKSLRTELREMTMQMAQMLADGVDPTSEAFLSVAERAGVLKDAMSDARSTINDYANDTKGLTNTLSVVETAVGGWQAFEGALSAFGLESEEASKATQKLMGIMSMMQGIQKISTELTTNGTGAYRAYHAILKLLGIEKAAYATATQAETAAATEAAVAQGANAAATEAAATAAATNTAAVGAETVALTGATAAATALKLALAALGIGAVIALIVALYQGVQEFNKEAEEAAEVSRGLNEAIKEGEKNTASTAAELKYYVGVVDDFNGSAEEEKALVDELNSKYGDTLGYYQSLIQWKSALVSMSEIYLDVLKWEAIAQANLNKYAEATAEGNAKAAEAYEKEFEFYKRMAAAQSNVLKNMIKIRGASTTKPTTSKATSSKKSSSSSSKDNDLEETQEMIEALINESNQMLDEWQKTATQRAIALAASITTTSVEAYESQVNDVRNLYAAQAELIEESRDKAITEKQKEYDEAIAKAKKYNKDTEQLEQARVTALTAISNEYQRELEDNTAQLNDTIAGMQSDLLTMIEQQGEAEIAGLQASNAEKMAIMRDRYIQELQEAEGNEQKIAVIKARYQRQSAQMAELLAIDTAQATVDSLEKALAVEKLSDDERERIAKELATAKKQLAKAVADAEENELERTTDDEQDARDKRAKLIQEWAQKVGEAVSSVTDLFSAMYDAQIAKIEEQMDADQERYDAQIAHIEDLAEQGSITTEEAEIRKREAQRATLKSQEQLEKKKSALEYKKGVMQKANSVSQIGIATALGIMQTFAQFGATPWGIALAAFVGAMGAVQLATALAQPIAAYKEGTKGKPHPGGLAIVGDGGRAEIVAYGRQAWITPDSPTLVDLPKGAEVYPSVTQDTLDKLGASLPTAIPRSKANGQPLVINDYSALEGRVAANTKAIARELRSLDHNVTSAIKQQAFADYLKRRL